MYEMPILKYFCWTLIFGIRYISAVYININRGLGGYPPAPQLVLGKVRPRPCHTRGLNLNARASARQWGNSKSTPKAHAAAHKHTQHTASLGLIGGRARAVLTHCRL